VTLSNEDARAVVERYVELVASGTADEVTALFAEDATVEDPIGTEPHVGHEAIRGFFATLAGLDRRTRLVTLRAGGGQAAFHFVIETRAGEKTFRVEPIDVMTFDDAGLITTMRAYWSDNDMVVS
jgi:steroid delta-isomerase